MLWDWYVSQLQDAFAGLQPHVPCDHSEPSAASCSKLDGLEYDGSSELRELKSHKDMSCREIYVRSRLVWIEGPTQLL